MVEIDYAKKFSIYLPFNAMGVPTVYVDSENPRNSTCSMIIKEIQKYKLFPADGLPKGEFLGLGSGDATGEMAIAKHFGFANPECTLVDISSINTVTGIWPGVIFCQSELHDFLAGVTKPKYSLITAFGLGEYLSCRQIWPETVKLIAQSLLPRGVFLLYYFYPQLWHQLLADKSSLKMSIYQSQLVALERV